MAGQAVFREVFRPRVIFHRLERDGELRGRCRRVLPAWSPQLLVLSEATGAVLDAVAEGLGLSRRIVEDEA